MRLVRVCDKIIGATMPTVYKVFRRIDGNLISAVTPHRWKPNKRYRRPLVSAFKDPVHARDWRNYMNTANMEIWLCHAVLIEPQPSTVYWGYLNIRERHCRQAFRRARFNSRWDSCWSHWTNSRWPEGTVFTRDITLNHVYHGNPIHPLHTSNPPIYRL